MTHAGGKIFPILLVGYPVVFEGVEVDETLVGADIGRGDEHVVVSDNHAAPHAVDAEA